MIFYSATITMLCVKLADKNILIKGGIKQKSKLSIGHLILKILVPLGNPPPNIHTKNKHNSQIPIDLIKPHERRYPVCLDGNILNGNYKHLPPLQLYHMPLNYSSWNCNRMILSLRQPLRCLLIKPQRISAKFQMTSIEVTKNFGWEISC